MRILVTAGPTREYIDDVRFLSNPSTGRMGFACAREALSQGHRVVLISGPVELDPPEGAVLIRVTSAEEMLEAVQSRLAWADALIMTAAVSDYRPAQRGRGKMKKDKPRLSLSLVRTPDILKTIGPLKGKRVFFGFAVEADHLEAFAADKMRRKGLDYIVANSPAAFGAEKTSAVLLSALGERQVFRGVAKLALAREIVKVLERKRAKDVDNG